MVKKKGGKINEIVYNYNEKYRYYPTITGLKSILKEIISANSTTEYIRITPFYINEKLNKQIEFEEYMFYIECRYWFDERAQDQHIKENLDVPDTPRTLNNFRLGSILYPLCQKDDVDSYKIALEKYKESLREILPKMMEIAKSEMELKDDDLSFGYFCFEIHSR